MDAWVCRGRHKSQRGAKAVSPRDRNNAQQPTAHELFSLRLPLTSLPQTTTKTTCGEANPYFTSLFLSVRVIYGCEPGELVKGKHVYSTQYTLTPGTGLVTWNSHFEKTASGIPGIPGNTRESKGIPGIHGFGGELELAPRISIIWDNLLFARCPR